MFKNRVRLRHLDCFVCVARTRHLGKAAAELRLSQPAVTKTLNELEEIVERRLFERSRAGAKLTPEGQTFLSHALAVLGALDAVEAALVSEAGEQTESLRIGALPTAAPDLLPAALESFRVAHPKVQLGVQTARNTVLLDMLKAGDIDIAVARMADPDKMLGLSFELLYVEPMVLAVRPGHALAAMSNVGLRDVMAFPLVLSPQGTIPRHNAESYFQSQGLRLPSNSLDTLSVSLAREITRTTDAVWIAQLGALRSDLALGVLAALDMPTAGMKEPVGLLLRSDTAPNAYLQALAATLREAAAARRD